MCVRRMRGWWLFVGGGLVTFEVVSVVIHDSLSKARCQGLHVCSNAQQQSDSLFNDFRRKLQSSGTSDSNSCSLDSCRSAFDDKHFRVVKRVHCTHTHTKTILQYTGEGPEMEGRNEEGRMEGRARHRMGSFIGVLTLINGQEEPLHFTDTFVLSKLALTISPAGPGQSLQGYGSTRWWAIHHRYACLARRTFGTGALCFALLA